MKRHMRRRSILIRVVVAVGLIALAPPGAHAEVRRTGDEPWYQASTADARQQAQALFAQALDRHQQLLRGEAMELYEQALALWDNPDIRWNLALVLENLGQYLRGYQQLEGVLRWGPALGATRLDEVRNRMRALETQHLARIEASSEEAGADIRLDGQPWFRDAEHRSTLVLPGEHYIGSTKPGYNPVTVSLVVVAGKHYRATLRMIANRLVETRRWSAWKPWTVVAAGVAVAMVGSGLEAQAFADRATAADAFAGRCHTRTCEPTLPPAPYDRAVAKNRLAIEAFVAGGTMTAVGLALAWLNRAHRSEAPRSPVEIVPSASPDQAGMSALVRF